VSIKTVDTFCERLPRRSSHEATAVITPPTSSSLIKEECENGDLYYSDTVYADDRGLLETFISDEITMVDDDWDNEEIPASSGFSTPFSNAEEAFFESPVEDACPCKKAQCVPQGCVSYTLPEMRWEEKVFYVSVCVFSLAVISFAIAYFMR
jgi:hypothetical protein